MTQRDRGIFSVLSIPSAYSLCQAVLGSARARQLFLEEYVKPAEGQRVLDIGCGTAAILENMPAVRYVGFDANPDYIRAARATFGNRGSFHVADIRSWTLGSHGEYDIVLAMGVLHHLNDEEARSLFAMSYDALRDGGRLVSIDPVFAAGQNRLARFLIGLDRGRNVRSEQEYAALAHRRFERVDTSVRRGLIRIPYWHVIAECIR